MTGSMQALICLIIIVALVVLWPLIGYLLRQRDYDRQIRGSRPERRARDGLQLSDEKQPDLKQEGLYYEYRMKKWQNMR